MAEDYIIRQATIDAVTDELDMIDHVPQWVFDRLEKRLKQLPSADVVPVVHSRWKYKCGEIQCPECGNKIHRIDLSGCLNFCPNCGAKMDGGDEHE